MYMYETYCTAQFINMRRFRFNQDQINKNLWNQETLDLINYKKNSVTFGKIITNFIKFRKKSSR